MAETSFSDYIEKQSNGNTIIQLVSVINGSMDVLTDFQNIGENYYKKNLSIIPNGNGIFNIGSDDKKYTNLFLSNEIYLDEIYSNNILTFGTNNNINFITPSINFEENVYITTDINSTLFNIQLPIETPLKKYVYYMKRGYVGGSLTFSGSDVEYQLPNYESNGGLLFIHTPSSINTVGFSFNIIGLHNHTIANIGYRGTARVTYFIQLRSNDDIFTRNEINATATRINYGYGDRMQFIVYAPRKVFCHGIISNLSQLLITNT